MAYYPKDLNPLEHSTYGFARGDDKEQQESSIHEHYAKEERNLPPFTEVLTDWQKLLEELEPGDALVVARFGSISRDVEELRRALRMLIGRGIVIVPVNDDYRQSCRHYQEFGDSLSDPKCFRAFDGLGELCQKILKEEDAKQEQKAAPAKPKRTKRGAKKTNPN